MAKGKLSAKQKVLAQSPEGESHDHEMSFQERQKIINNTINAITTSEPLGSLMPIVFKKPISNDFPQIEKDSQAKGQEGKEEKEPTVGKESKESKEGKENIDFFYPLPQ